MQFLRQSTASQEVLLGPFVDSTDGNTEETALTIANTDIKLWKTGATTLANKNSGGATHISNGEYYAVLDATDTDTIGPMVVRVHVAGALAVRLFCTVLDEAVYDVLFGTTAPATATNITAATGITLAAVTHTGAVIPTVSALTGHTPQTGDSYARLGAPAGASLAADVAAVKSDTAAILLDTGTDGVVLNAAGLAADAANEIADALLNRNISGGSSAGRTVKQALHFLRNKWSIAAGTLTVTDTDDTTASWTATVATAASDPVNSVDPA